VNVEGSNPFARSNLFRQNAIRLPINGRATSGF
jgi:hypothetical protein